ncbi:MAG: hypothetical protein LWX70_05075 [Sphingobacteriia bacterium]|nr:hypothetical protein [Sphingobacteriia bacterium]
MNEDQLEFERNIEKLIHLLLEMKEDGRLPDQIPGIDKNMIAGVDLLLKSFEHMKSDQRARDQLYTMAGPYKELIKQMIAQLSEELEENALIHPKESNVTTVKPVITEETPVEIGPFVRRLVQIDQILANMPLGSPEVDELLDERSRIMKKLNP